MSGLVLLVADDPNEIGVLRSLLREEGYRVDVVGSGRGALLSIADEHPDVVMLSMGLPDMDGLTACRRIQELDPEHDVPVVFLGGMDDDTGRAEAIEAGAVDFLASDLAPREILARLRRHVTVARVRQALRESEARLRAVTESAVDAIVSADGSGSVLSWNRAAERLFGFSSEEMLGRDLTAIIPERFREAHRQGLQRVASGGPSRVIGRTVELAGLRADGSEFPVELSLATWLLDGARYFTGILRDISERKQAEERFRSVTESAIDAIVSADHESRIVGWNRAAEEMFGRPAEEMLGESLFSIIPERFREAHRHGMDRLTRTGQSRVIGKTVEVAALRRDGGEFPIELSLSTWTVDDRRYYTGIIRDITARKEAEAKLRGYAGELARQHRELRLRHEELQRSQEALAASFRQTQKLFSAMTDGLPGATLNGKYRLEEKVAAGGFGVVYRAEQVTLRRRVAVKLLRPPSHEDEEAVFARFRREGMSACRIRHPNAVSIIDLDVTDGGFPYIVMEYLEGQTLGQVLEAQGRLAPRDACTVAADVCAVLAASHRAGVVHRDIKPSNVFLQAVAQPRVKVLDFGIARLIDEPGLSRVTRTGQFIGTPSYMAPERLHATGRETELSDVFSVGVMLYEALAGQLPIPPQETLVQTIRAHLDGDPVPIRQVRPEVPEPIQEILGRALSRDPRRRPSASQLESTLRDLLADPELNSPSEIDAVAAVVSAPPRDASEAPTQHRAQERGARAETR